MRRLVVASLSVISIAALAVFVLHNRNVSSSIEGHVTAMTTLLERGDVESAKSYADTLQKEQPDMLVVPQIQVLLIDIEQAGHDEDARRDAFAVGVAMITERLDSVTTLVDATSLQVQLDALNSRGDAEIEIVQELTESIENKQSQIQEQNDNAFTSALTKVAVELNDYEETGQKDIKRFEEFRSTLVQLGETPEVSAELISNPTGPAALAARCATHIFDMNVQVKRDQMLRQITASVGSVPQYRTAIDAYVKEFPKDDVLAVRLENLLRTEADFWPQVDVQNEFVSLHSIDCTRLKPLEARKYLAEAEAFLVSHPQFPRRMELTKICDYLRFVSRRLDEDGQPIHARIMDELDNANLEDLYTVLLGTGQRHYTDKEPEFQKEVGKVQFFRLPEAFVPRQREAVARNIAQGLVDIHYRDKTPDWDAPESVLIREIEKELSGIDEHDWERVMVGMLERVYGETRQDPIFQLFMLKAILETAVSGSPLISTHYARVLEQMKDEPLNNINPFDPEDERTNLVRKHVSELLKPVRNPATVLLPELMPYRESMSKLSIGGRYRWFGWLNRGPAGWVCLSDTPLGADVTGTLFIYTKGAADVPRFYQIGTISNGTTTVTDTSAFLTEGQPIYVYEE